VSQCSVIISGVDAHHYKLLEDVEVAELVLDSLAASGFASNTRYLVWLHQHSNEATSW
jgi:hypothetical protein